MAQLHETFARLRELFEASLLYRAWLIAFDSQGGIHSHGRLEKSGEHCNVAENHGHNLHVMVILGRKYGQNIAIYHFLCAVVVCTGWTPAPKAFGRWRVAKLDALGVEDDSSGPHGCDQEIKCGSSMSLKLKPGDFRHRLELPSSHQRWWFQPGDVLSGHYKPKETPKQPQIKPNKILNNAILSKPWMSNKIR